MFYQFLYPLRELFFGFNVFKYITFRAVMASITSFMLCIIFGPWLIKKLSQLKIGANIIEPKISPQLHNLHQGKSGIPSMGGLLILFSVILSTLLWSDLANKYVWLVLFSTFSLGLLGITDDYLKHINKRSKGISKKAKLTGQTILATIIALFAFHDPQIGPGLDIPFFKDFLISLGVFYIIFVVVVIVGCSNAVNLTDGLDGLAIGCVAMVAITYAIFSYLSGHANFSSYLQIRHFPGSGELAVFCFSIIGAALGFLWFNAHPAEVFMGDTGSLALGGALGVVAVLIKKELVLFIAGGIFVAEAVSVILQVASFKLRGGKRIFLIAPLHHHFQLKGLAESKVTIRFWIISIILEFSQCRTIVSSLCK